ncbi:recombinase family protein [Chryseobacterium sp.]|uniref:recombinase family protein n=1 Tax=Chryseobacterium sp. TaxID=1871047 RepID=UPI0012C92E03|nr:recombinase family protein [Chryseobacterium sp.]MPS66520.1 recombinase family protein [Chryseobacterium sp.]
MKTADLYIRVSTDEQADKGYSQRDQEERLRRFCSQNNYTVGNIIYEDHSAKSFNRPEWTKLLVELKKKSSKTNLILFTKWDRFSRNAGDAYQMISILSKIGVDLQAVEQPLDLSIPENKMMLAIYLAAPEVENDRRALNVFYGMRRAVKEGRVMGKAPFGYANKMTENGKKYIAVKEPEAAKMKWAFNELAKGIYASNSVRIKINESLRKGISRTSFHLAIRNPIYCGKVFVPKHKDEAACFVEGQHEALISEELFDRVQEILDGKKRTQRPNIKITVKENFPLRGFLTCPNCGKTLTASASKGRNNRYFYYHCNSVCGFRERAELVNKVFEDGLMTLEMNEPIKKYLKKILTDNYKNFIDDPLKEKKKISDEIDTLNNRLSFARNKFLSEVIDDDEYLEIKKECKEQILKLEEDLNKNSVPQISNIDKLLEQALETLQNIGKHYLEGGIETKRAIIGSIFPEKLEFDGKHYRTTRINSIAHHIFQINNKLVHNKKKRNNHIDYFSLNVARRGIEPLLPE